MKGYLKTVLVLLGLFSLGLLSGGVPAGAAEADRPGWWDRASAQAGKDGYGLITTRELKALYDSGEEFLVLDVRPDYEYQADHLPGARNLEFHLGDRSRLGPTKREALLALLGPDKGRLIVIYCRSYA